MPRSKLGERCKSKREGGKVRKGRECEGWGEVGGVDRLRREGRAGEGPD